MRKPVFCICENKDADQLRGNREADQRLCFRFTDTVDLEKFARTLFSLIFANSGPREFKVLAYIENTCF